jgi:hypothetical protein
MVLTQRQLDVLSDVVEDPQAWADHAEQSKAGVQSVLSKIAKYESDYDSKKNEDGYKTRKQQEDEFVISEQEQYDNVSWDVKRQREYPTIAELVVALYDTDDKADIDKRRAEIKTKYPKE